MEMSLRRADSSVLTKLVAVKNNSQCIWLVEEEKKLMIKKTEQSFHTNIEGKNTFLDAKTRTLIFTTTSGGSYTNSLSVRGRVTLRTCCLLSHLAFPRSSSTLFGR